MCALLLSIVERVCCLLLSNDAESDDVLPATQLIDKVAILDAREMVMNEVVALVFVLMLPIWIVLGLMICLLQSYGNFVGISSRTCNFTIFALTSIFESQLHCANAADQPSILSNHGHTIVLHALVHILVQALESITKCVRK